MNRSRPLETPRAGYRLRGPFGTALSVFVGAAALIVVGAALGKGLDPPSAPADLVAVQGRASGAQSAGEGLIGALSAALRSLGVAQPEPEVVVLTSIPEVIQTVVAETAEEPDPLPAQVVVVEDPSAPAVVEQRLVAPDAPVVVAAALPDTLAFEPIMADDAGEDTEEMPLVPQEPAFLSSAGPFEAPPPPPLAPPRPPIAPSGLATPTPAAQPTRRPMRAPIPPTSTRQPRLSATPKGSATPHPTTVLASPTTVRTAVPTSKPRVELEGNESRLGERRRDD